MWLNNRREKEGCARDLLETALAGAGKNEDQFPYTHSGHDSFFVKTE